MVFKMSGLFSVLFMTWVLLASAEVVELTADNFKSVGLSKEFALVEFYAPWCGHCKALEPEYTELGNDLESQHEISNVVIAKVDATVEEALAQSFQIDGYPTIKLIRSSDEKVVEYRNAPSYDELLAFVQEMTTPPVVEVVGWNEIEEVRESQQAYAIGYFPGNEKYAKTFENAAFGSTIVHLMVKSSMAEIEDMYGVKSPSVIISNPGNDNGITILTEDVLDDDTRLSAAIRNSLISKFGEWNEENLDFALDAGIEHLGLLFKHDSDTESFDLFAKVASELPQNFIAMHTRDEEDDHLLDFFDVDQTQFPKFIVLHITPEEEDPKVFHYDREELDAAGVVDFVNRVISDAVEPTPLPDPYAEDPYEELSNLNFEDGSPMEDQYGDSAGHDEL